MSYFRRQLRSVLLEFSPTETEKLASTNSRPPRSKRIPTAKRIASPPPPPAGHSGTAARSRINQATSQELGSRTTPPRSGVYKNQQDKRDLETVQQAAQQVYQALHVVQDEGMQRKLMVVYQTFMQAFNQVAEQYLE